MVVLGIQSLHCHVHGGFMERKNKKHLMSIVRATERDDSSSQRFEIDRDKAREALKQLDQQIESQADEKPRNFVKTTSSEVVRTSSGVIKPSMDGPESVPEAKTVAMSDSELVQFPLSSFPEKTLKQ
ncbi:hypothetical protein Bca4012_013638 [Brassica carinata]